MINFIESCEIVTPMLDSFYKEKQVEGIHEHILLMDEIINWELLNNLIEELDG
jgi:hypothetical protein